MTRPSVTQVPLAAGLTVRRDVARIRQDPMEVPYVLLDTHMVARQSG